METVEVVLLDAYGSDFPENGLALMQWVQSWIDKAPPEYRNTVNFDFSPKYEHGEEYSNIKITYSRPATAEEAQEIKNRDIEIEARLYAQYESRKAYQEALEKFLRAVQ